MKEDSRSILGLPKASEKFHFGHTLRDEDGGRKTAISPKKVFANGWEPSGKLGRNRCFSAVYQA